MSPRGAGAPARATTRRAALVIALACAVTALTPARALAQSDAPAPAASEQVAPAPVEPIAAPSTEPIAAPSTEPSEKRPLQLRPSKPGDAAAESGGTSVWTKLLLALAVIAAAVVVFRRRPFSGHAGNSERPTPSLRVSARTSVGMRTELLIVEADGQRLLLGVTPTAVQTLSVLGDAPSELAAGLSSGAAALDDDEFERPRIAVRPFERALGRVDVGRSEPASAEPPRDLETPTVERSLAKLIATARADAADLRDESLETPKGRRASPRPADAAAGSSRKPRGREEGPLEGQVRGLGTRRGNS